MAFQIVSRVLFGADIDQHAQQIVEILKVINIHLQSLCVMLILIPWLPVMSNRHFLRMRNQSDLIVQESLCLYPLIWAVARQNTETIKLGGYRIPAKSYLIIPIYSLHRHRNY